MRWLMYTERERAATHHAPATVGSGAGTACGHDVEISGENLPGEGLDLVSCVAGEDRTPPPDRPWVALNMVCSVDGASADDQGRSAGLSGPADRALFKALRAIADVIVVGAGTARAENYGPVRLPPEAEAMRAANKQPPLPRLAVVCGSLRLDPTARLFEEAPPDQPPILLTTNAGLALAPSATALATVAELHAVGESTVEWGRAFQVLRDHYDARVVLVEGGPTVNSQLVENDLVDELRLTLSPRLVGGDTWRIVADARLAHPLALRLDRVLEDDGFLMLRYLRERDEQAIEQRPE